MADQRSLTGITFPFAFNAGKVRTSEDAQHLKECVHHVIVTGKREVVMRLDFGSDLYRRVFSPINIAALVAHDIRSAISKYEQRVIIKSINAHTDTGHVGVLFIDVDFTFKDTFHQLSINYPVEEG